jgi:hypothetical protein
MHNSRYYICSLINDFIQSVHRHGAREEVLVYLKTVAASHARSSGSNRGFTHATTKETERRKKKTLRLSITCSSRPAPRQGPHTLPHIHPRSLIRFKYILRAFSSVPRVRALERSCSLRMLQQPNTRHSAAKGLLSSLSLMRVTRE